MLRRHNASFTMWFHYHPINCNIMFFSESQVLTNFFIFMWAEKPEKKCKMMREMRPKNMQMKGDFSKERNVTFICIHKLQPILTVRVKNLWMTFLLWKNNLDYHTVCGGVQSVRKTVSLYSRINIVIHKHTNQMVQCSAELGWKNLLFYRFGGWMENFVSNNLLSL